MKIAIRILALSLALTAGAAATAGAQQRGLWSEAAAGPHIEGAIDIDALDARPVAVLADRLESGRAPRWLRWGLIGGAAGGLTFMALGRLSVDGEPNPPLQDAAHGAVVGFAITAAAVGFYDWICAPGSTSRRAGLCGR